MTWFIVVFTPYPCRDDVDAYMDTLWLRFWGIKP